MKAKVSKVIIEIVSCENHLLWDGLKSLCRHTVPLQVNDTVVQPVLAGNAYRMGPVSVLLCTVHNAHTSLRTNTVIGAVYKPFKSMAWRTLKELWDSGLII